jgi:hypothetical protein
LEFTKVERELVEVTEISGIIITDEMDSYRISFLKRASSGQKQITLRGSQLNTYINSNIHAFWHGENCTTDDYKHCNIK